MDIVDILDWMIMDIHTWIMDVYSIMDIYKCNLSYTQFDYGYAWFTNIQNWIMYIHNHNWIVDIQN